MKSLIRLSLLVYFGALTAAQFSRLPETQTVNIGSDAIFECQFPTADSIGWVFGGESVNRITESATDFTQDTYRDSDNQLVYTLTVLARPEYNGTAIMCVATLFAEPSQHYSSPAILITEDTCGSSSVSTAFIEMPMSGNVAVGSEARFRCRHRRTNRLFFEIDEQSVNESRAENASIVVFPDESGRSLFVLAFEATQVVDGSTIVCVAVFIDSCPDEATVPALLFIQGPLSAVTGFRRLSSSQLTFSWTPPPTLDLTGIDPDIAYSIKIYNITCGSRELVSSNDNFTTSFYRAATLDPGYVYEVEVVPRSNVPGSKNGTAFVKYERFGERNVSFIVVTENTSGVIIEYALESARDMENARARSYSLLLQPLDNPEGSEMLDISEAVLRDVLPRRQLWLMTAMAYGCREHNVSKTTVISTHDIQDISVVPIAGGANVTGEFVDNSSAEGVLIIAYSIARDSGIRYIFAERPTAKQETVASLTGLPLGNFQLSVFVVDENAVPVRQVASLPSNVSINQASETVVELPIKYDLQPISTGVCVTCTFLDSATTDCVAVVHQRISQLSSSGLMDIESSHKFNRSGDTAYGCIEGVNLEQYQIGVVGGIPVEVGGMAVKPTKESTPLHIIVPAVVVPLGIIVLIILCVSVCILCKCRDRKKNSFVVQKTHCIAIEESSFGGDTRRSGVHECTPGPLVYADLPTRTTVTPPCNPVQRRSQENIPAQNDETAPLIILGDQGIRATVNGNHNTLEHAALTSGTGSTVSGGGNDVRQEEDVDSAIDVHLNDGQMPEQGRPISQSSQGHDAELVVTPDPHTTASTSQSASGGTPPNSQGASGVAPTSNDDAPSNSQLAAGDVSSNSQGAASGGPGALSNSQEADNVPPITSDDTLSNSQGDSGDSSAASDGALSISQGANGVAPTTNDGALLNAQEASGDSPVTGDYHSNSQGSDSNLSVANSDDSAMNGASPSVPRPHQVENKINPSKVMYVATKKNFPGVPISPQDSIPDEEDSHGHTSNVNSDDVTNTTNGAVHVDDSDIPSTVHSAENPTDPMSTTAQDSPLYQEKQNLFQQRKPEISSDGGHRLPRGIALGRHNNNNSRELYQPLQQSETFPRNEEREDVSTRADSSYPAPFDQQ